MRRFASRAALAAGAIVLSLLVLEIATRLSTELDRVLTVDDPVVGRRYIAGFEDEVYVPEARRHVLLRFNQEGFRGPDRPRAKPPGVRRLALVGDSFVLAAGIDEPRTMAALLESRLNESTPETPWQVLNFGVSASSTGQELALYRGVVRRYTPDVVVLAFAVINDLADSSPRLTSSSAIYFDLDSRGELVQLPVRASETPSWLNRHSRFYLWQKLALRDLRYRLRERVGVLKPGKWIYARDDHPADVAHAWRLVERLLRTFATEVEADGARFALLLIPAPEQIYDDRWRQVLANAGDAASGFDRSHPERRLARISGDAGVTLITLTEAFRRQAPSASLEAEDEHLYLAGGIGHLNDLGNRIAAQELYDELVRSLPELMAARALEE